MGRCDGHQLRFAVGTVVEAKVAGGFKRGVVVKQWPGASRLEDDEEFSEEALVRRVCAG